MLLSNIVVLRPVILYKVISGTDQTLPVNSSSSSQYSNNYGVENTKSRAAARLRFLLILSLMLKSSEIKYYVIGFSYLRKDAILGFSRM